MRHLERWLGIFSGEANSERVYAEATASFRFIRRAVAADRGRWLLVGARRPQELARNCVGQPDAAWRPVVRQNLSRLDSGAVLRGRRSEILPGPHRRRPLRADQAVDRVFLSEDIERR